MLLLVIFLFGCGNKPTTPTTTTYDSSIIAWHGLDTGSNRNSDTSAWHDNADTGGYVNPLGGTLEYKVYAMIIPKQNNSQKVFIRDSGTSGKWYTIVYSDSFYHYESGIIYKAMYDGKGTKIYKPQPTSKLK